MDQKTPGFYEKVAPILLVIVIALAFAVGVLWQKVSDLSKGSSVTGANNTNTGAATAEVPQGPVSGKLEPAQAEKLGKVSAKDHIQGSADASIILIEYSDFECPFCSNFHATAKRAKEEYGNKIAWVYRHFPLDSIHPKARPAANASECVAALAGKEAFWKFADEVFANQATALSDLSAVAIKLGVNKAAFESCLNEKRYENVVENDYQGGLSAGVTGTPGNFVVNSKGEVWLVPGAVPYDNLKSTIEEALGN